MTHEPAHCPAEHYKGFSFIPISPAATKRFEEAIREFRDATGSGGKLHHALGNFVHGGGGDFGNFRCTRFKLSIDAKVVRLEDPSYSARTGIDSSRLTTYSRFPRAYRSVAEAFIDAAEQYGELIARTQRANADMSGLDLGPPSIDEADLFAVMELEDGITTSSGVRFHNDGRNIVRTTRSKIPTLFTEMPRNRFPSTGNVPTPPEYAIRSPREDQIALWDARVVQHRAPELVREPRMIDTIDFPLPQINR